MSDVQTVRRMLALCRAYGLSGLSFCYSFPPSQLAEDFNGIGPAWFPEVLRKAIDGLSADMMPAAFIHDVRYAHNDGSTRDFNEANAELEANGRLIADAKYPWWHIRRYLIRHEAKVYARLCARFGWTAYVAANVNKRGRSGENAWRETRDARREEGPPISSPV